MAIRSFVGLVVLSWRTCSAWYPSHAKSRPFVATSLVHSALSNDYLENDLVAVRPSGEDVAPRLCAVTPDAEVVPLCIHEDDVETDLYVDPRVVSESFWQKVTDEDITGTYGEGFYGQRPVPSLGGGLGYGAPSDDVWSASEEILEQVRADGVEIPVLDVGIAHGEKARGGAL